MRHFTRVLSRLSAFPRGGDAWVSVCLWGRRIGLALLCVGACVGSLQIKERVERDPRLRLENWVVELVDLPEWVTPEIRDEVAVIDLSRAGEPLGLYQRNVLTRVKEIVESSPWVRDVASVGVAYPTVGNRGALEVRLRLRAPVALVEHGGLYYLADCEGTRLGEGYREAPTRWFRVPAITNVPRTDELPAAGESWRSRDVLQGIAVANALHDGGLYRDFPGCPIDRIDLANLHGQVNPRSEEIVLWAGEKQLRWGRSPISSGARVVPVEDLLAHLREVLARPEAYAAYRVIHLDGLRGRLDGSSG